MGGPTHTACFFLFSISTRNRAVYIHLHLPTALCFGSDRKFYQGQSHADEIVQMQEELEKKKAKGYCRDNA